VVDAPVLHRLLLVTILAGLGLSLFSTAEYLDPALTSVCSPNPLWSCGGVLKSGDTGFPPPTGPIPDFAVGVAGFVLLLVLDLLLLRTYEKRWLLGILLLSVVGLLVAASLLATEAFLIHAYCPICVGSYIADLGVFLLALVLWRTRRRAEAEIATEGRAPSPTSG
jgi:uncharacterized membrane protein